MNWNNWYLMWGWVLWFGIIILFISNLGNWGYTYRVYRQHRNKSPQKSAQDFLNDRYSRGEINRDEYLKIKSEISR